LFSVTVVFDLRLAPIDPRPTWRPVHRLLVPAHGGGYGLDLEPDRENRTTRGQPVDRGTVTVFQTGSMRPLVWLPDVEGVVYDRPPQGGYADRVPFDRRGHFIADAKLLVTLAAANDRLVLRPLDPVGQLDAAGGGYLV